MGHELCSLAQIQLEKNRESQRRKFSEDYKCSALIDMHKINGIHRMRQYDPHYIPYECYKLDAALDLDDLDCPVEKDRP